MCLNSVRQNRKSLFLNVGFAFQLVIYIDLKLQDFLQSWAQFCCKMWGGQLGVKPIYSNYRVDAEVKFYKYRFPILFLEVF